MPQANLDKKDDSVPPTPPVTVTVKEDGSLYWNDAPITKDLLESQLSVEAQKTPQPRSTCAATNHRTAASARWWTWRRRRASAKVGFVATRERPN